MGTGKSTIGRAVAERLGLPFVDTDQLIVDRAGMPIQRIFETHGEARFRQLERAVAEELTAPDAPRAVIAVGGGMVVNPQIRTSLLASCLCIGLHASPDVIYMRVGGEGAADTRPMLRSETPGGVRARITQLLAERAPAYRELHYHVDTTDRWPNEIVDRICDIARCEQLRITVAIPNHPAYDIVMGDGLLTQLGALLRNRGWTAPAAIVSDKIVASHYAGTALLALKAADIDAFVHTIEYGERNKTLASVEGMYRAFSAHGMDRRSPVIALGGGVVGDAAGFAAATYLRGVPFVQAPTSLLAMADSSIGGKTGVDTNFGKNLVGAFKQPDLVIADTRCLGTLPAIELREGCAEIIKAAVLRGGDLYQRALAFAQSPLREADDHMATGADGLVDALLMDALLGAIELKREVVEADPHERGRRAILNLGHTFGHGIETWSGLRVKHGHCVALGITCALRLSQQLGHCDAGFVEQVLGMLRGVGLPTAWRDVQRFGAPPLDADGVLRAMRSDKKKVAGTLRFILARGPGDVFVSAAVTEAQARETLAGLTIHN